MRLFQKRIMYTKLNIYIFIGRFWLSYLGAQVVWLLQILTFLGFLII
jgi:hypothetical protein